MRHTKLIAFGIVLVGAVIFGFIFWGDLIFNQQQIANMPMPVDSSSNGFAQQGRSERMSSSDSFGALEKDLNETDLEIDSDLADMEAEMQGL